jgi:hypothetical protein
LEDTVAVLEGVVAQRFPVKELVRSTNMSKSQLLALLIWQLLLKGAK